MYHDNQRMATKLYEGLDNLILKDDNGKEASIDNLLDGTQKYHLIMSILNILPKTDFQSVLEFNKIFKVEKETTHVVTDFKDKQLTFELILEEVLELGKALGIETPNRYMSCIQINSKVDTKEIEPSLTEVGDALTDLLYVVYRGFYVYNLEDIQYDLMQEVHNSNLSKIIPSNENALEIIKNTVQSYKDKGILVTSNNLKNGYIAIVNRDTGKILKPVTYTIPDLKTIINKHLNK